MAHTFHRKLVKPKKQTCWPVSGSRTVVLPHLELVTHYARTGKALFAKPVRLIPGAAQVETTRALLPGGAVSAKAEGVRRVSTIVRFAPDQKKGA